VSILSIFERFLLAWRSYFRVLFDPEFAVRLLSLDEPAGQLEAASRTPQVDSSEPGQSELEPPAVAPARSATAAGPSASDGALQLLGLLQREGRLVDFFQQDVGKFSDGQIGQAARVVHEGCRAILKRYVRIEAVLEAPEGETTTVPSGFDPAAIKLVGNVSGNAPFNGILRHRGWRAASIHLPETLPGHTFAVLAPAEVEVG
jgi:hypothetical protein